MAVTVNSPIILLVILFLLLLIIFATTLEGNLLTGIKTAPLSTSATLTKSKSFIGVKLNTGQYMELIEEETCTRNVIRLTCRSLRASLLVLDAVYSRNRSDLCAEEDLNEYEEDDDDNNEVKKENKNEILYRIRDGKKEKKLKYFEKKMDNLRGNYVDDYDYEIADLRLFVTKRCSGFQHCRFNVDSDHPEAAFWNSANLKLKYACIPEAAIFRYCNMKISVPGGQGGYLKSPGYPHYYPGGSSCGWRFESLKGQRISLTLHDLDIRNAERDGSCVDVVRVRDNGVTLLESCGTSTGVEILSLSNVLTLDLIALSNLYPSRGFMLQYRAIGCPAFDPPSGSYVAEDNGDRKTLLCKSSSGVFLDTKKRSKFMACENGIWNYSGRIQPGCVDSSAAILKAEKESGRFNSLGGDEGVDAGSVYVPAYGVDVRSTGANAIPPPSASGSQYSHFDDSGSSYMKNAVGDGITTMKGEYDIVNVVLPTVLIALLFIGNAIIVYVIFQYRKRKQPPFGESIGEEMALRGPETQLPQV